MANTTVTANANNKEFFNDFKPLFSWNIWDKNPEMMPEDFAKPVNMSDEEWSDLQDSLYLIR